MHTELNWLSNSWIKHDDKDARWMMSKGNFLFDNDFSNKVDGFSDIALSNIFEDSNTRATILGDPSLVIEIS